MRPGGDGICIATLLDSTPDPLLRRRGAGWSADDEADEAAGSGSDSEADDVDVRVHGGGIGRRIRVLPMRPARLESLQVLDDAHLLEA